MSQRGSKIIGLLIFLIIVFAISFAALIPGKNQAVEKIKSVNIAGNHLLAQRSYLNFAQLTEAKNLIGINLPIIKDRLEKHPFISFAEVELSKFGNAKVQLYEKSFIALLIIEDRTYVLSDELQMLPLYPETKFIDLPIMINPRFGKNYQVLDYLDTQEMIEANNILYAIKNSDHEMFKALSEINLNDGNDITLTFSGIHPVIKFGHNNIPSKVLSLVKIWSLIKESSSELNSSDYIDLRFTEQIYFGTAQEVNKEI